MDNFDQVPTSISMPSMTEEQMVMSQVENMSNKTIAEFVESKINFDFAKSYLVKMGDPIMVKRIVKVPKPLDEEAAKSAQTADELPEMEMVEEEMDVESVYAYGYVLKVPASAAELKEKYNVGDKVYFRKMRATDFDIIPKSALVDQFDIVCKEDEK